MVVGVQWEASPWRRSKTHLNLTAAVLTAQHQLLLFDKTAEPWCRETSQLCNSAHNVTISCLFRFQNGTVHRFNPAASYKHGSQSQGFQTCAIQQAV